MAAGRKLLLLLLLFAVAVPRATAQGRSPIRIVECINESLKLILMDLDSLHEIIIQPNSTSNLLQETSLEDINPSLFQKLQMSEVESSWLNVDAVDLAELFAVRVDEPTIDCTNNTDCQTLVSALDDALVIIDEVNSDDIYDGQVARIYDSKDWVTAVYHNATEDQELRELFHDNIDYLEAQTKVIQSGNDDVSDLRDQLKSKESVAIILGMVALLLAFIGFSTGSYYCYQRTRKDEGVAEGLIIE